MTTLKDVAREANVSQMTVSRVINHPEQVTEELKQLVYDAMKTLNYHPNIAAKALANNRTQIIKFVILEEIDTVEPYYMYLLTGIANELEKHQYTLQLVTHRNISLGDCDGYIITGARDKDFEWIDTIKEPVIIFGENRHGYDYIDTDNVGGIAKATRYAIKQHYANINFIGIDMDEPFEYSREEGYIREMQKEHLVPTIFRCINRSTAARELIEKNWEDFEPNTMFICSSDRIALGVERAVHSQNGKIPQDYGIIGHDGVFLDQIAFPKLSTIRQNVVFMGEQCAVSILKKVFFHNVSVGNQHFKSELILRDTTR